MRLCVGAKLNLDETKDLLARAGYALSPCVIINKTHCEVVLWKLQKLLRN